MSHPVQPQARSRAATVQGSHEHRAHERRALCLPGRMTWLDIDGTRRTARIRTRDVSEGGAFVECVRGCGAIPLYRLVELKLDDAARLRENLPGLLRQPSAPAAVYRVGPSRPSTGLPDGFALRLLVTPPGRRKHARVVSARATKIA